MTDNDGRTSVPPFPSEYRASGLLLHVTSLPSPYGVGDLGSSAFSWIDRLHGAGQRWWQALPLGPTGYGNSPYQSMSSFAGNELLISPGSLISHIVSSGDDAEDAQSRANFVQKYQEMHRLVKEPDRTTTLYIGAENWPAPIPLLNKGNAWYFDTEAGKKEILLRRIGRNEMSSIRVCQELVAAEKEYSTQHGEYAQKIFGDEGHHNGLYWKPADGEPQSPIGPLVATAFVEDYASNRDGAAAPYRGYYYRILTRQGKNAAGGAKSYIPNGKMTAGFAFMAYPAEYRSSV
jgi:hypothetical protein